MLAHGNRETNADAKLYLGKVSWSILLPKAPLTKALARSTQWHQAYSDKYSVICSPSIGVADLNGLKAARHENTNEGGRNRRGKG
jgi:hypothetical protein